MVNERRTLQCDGPQQRFFQPAPNLSARKEPLTAIAPPQLDGFFLRYDQDARQDDLAALGFSEAG
jgi:hypothetical protein